MVYFFVPTSLPSGLLLDYQTHYANAVWFRIGVLTYNLFIAFKREVLPAACQSWSLPKLRWTLFSMPGKIVRHARTLRLKLAVSVRDIAFLIEVRQRCRLLFETG